MERITPSLKRALFVAIFFVAVNQKPYKRFVQMACLFQ